MSAGRPTWSWSDPLMFPHVLFYVMGLATGAVLVGLIYGR